MNTLRKLRRQMDIIVSEVRMVSKVNVAGSTWKLRGAAGCDRPGVHDQRHQRAGDQNLHRRRTDLSTAVNC